MQTIVSNDPHLILEANTKALKSAGYGQHVVAYCGGLNQDLIHRLTEHVESSLISSGTKKAIVKRIFSIVIEGLQNVLIHGDRLNNEPLCLLIVSQNAKGYCVNLGNLAKHVDQARIVGYLNQLNEMNDEEVKAFYMEVLNNGLISEKGGAGLGFITMRMKSKEKLDYKFESWSENIDFFTISCFLVKED